MHRLSAIAAARKQTMQVAIRVNPDVDALTHAKISTGKKENKFGIDIDDAVEAYGLAAALPGVEPVGIAVHIGSQLLDLAPFRRAFGRVAELILELRGAGFAVSRLDLGGGLGIRYHAETPPEPRAYAALVREIFGTLDVDLAFEPGRALCGPSGLLVGRVVYVKDGATKRFVIIDAAMNDLIRPALYDAWHDIVPVRLPEPGAVLAPADVVGPVCETGDTFATERDLPPLGEDDLVAMTNAGAYGAVMSSTYNSRPLVPEVLVSDDRFAVIRKRPSFEAMVEMDIVPEWLAAPCGPAESPPFPAEVMHAEHLPARRPARAEDAAGPGSAAVGTGLARLLAGSVRSRHFRGCCIVRSAAGIAGPRTRRTSCTVRGCIRCRDGLRGAHRAPRRLARHIGCASPH